MKKLYVSGALSLSLTMMAMLSSIAYADPAGCNSKDPSVCTDKYASCPYNLSLGKIEGDNNGLGGAIYHCELNGAKDECQDGTVFMECYSWLDPRCREQMEQLEQDC